MATAALTDKKRSQSNWLTDFLQDFSLTLPHLTLWSFVTTCTAPFQANALASPGPEFAAQTNSVLSC
jgi:hypothetical protein